QLLSHKVMRYLVPFFLILLFVSAAALAPRNAFYAVAFAAQGFGYLAAALSWVLERAFKVHSRLLALPQYFVLANLASLIAWYKFLRGERFARWEPIREPAATTTADQLAATAAQPVAAARARES
ncbi:MAG TPA: hypothetical protein VER76_13705, partial [Pyrinomonadaceae bacterium]|nr:hypothetical protein [Pyrinomonadaceae bacterium]